MATKMDPKCYENMITALNNFVNKTGETSTQLFSAVSTCQQVLGQSDPATSGLASNAQAIATTYQALVTYAKKIATDMQQELEAYYHKEQRNWSSDSDDNF